MYIFNFPHNAEARKLSYREQVSKIADETKELAEAAEAGNDFQIIEEALDVIVAVEGLLQKYSENYIDAMAEAVTQKNLHRGYWILEED